MTFWFCYNCKKSWHSFIRTPDKINKIKCFFCMENTSVKIKQNGKENVLFEDYDKNLRKFKMLKNKEYAKKKSLS